jgi:hypothetical protein
LQAKHAFLEKRLQDKEDRLRRHDIYDKFILKITGWQDGQDKRTI